MFTLHNGDCLQVMPTITSGSIDAIITDLPYKMTDCDWDSIIPLVDMWREAKRILKPSGAFITTSSQPFSSLVVASNIKNFKVEWIWKKNAGSNFGTCKFQPMKEHESILVFSNNGKKITYNPIMQERAESGKSRVKTKINASTQNKPYQNGGLKPIGFMASELRYPSSVQYFNRERGLHPTQKPVALYEYLIKTYTNEGETVLDIAMGSGTTIEAAERTGRNSIGIEKDEGIFQSAVLRLKPFTPSNNRLHSDLGDSPAQQALFTPEADTAEGKLPAPAPRR